LSTFENIFFGDNGREGKMAEGKWLRGKWLRGKYIYLPNYAN
jgi:hypothetical protein